MHTFCKQYHLQKCIRPLLRHLENRESNITNASCQSGIVLTFYKSPSKFTNKSRLHDELNLRQSMQIIVIGIVAGFGLEKVTHSLYIFINILREDARCTSKGIIKEKNSH